MTKAEKNLGEKEKTFLKKKALRAPKADGRKKAKKPLSPMELKLFLTDVIKGNVIDGLTHRGPSIQDQMKAVDQLSKIYNDETNKNADSELMQKKESEANKAILSSVSSLSEQEALELCNKASDTK